VRELHAAGRLLAMFAWLVGCGGGGGGLNAGGCNLSFYMFYIKIHTYNFLTKELLVLLLVHES
jgi:hypothetical protein